MVRPTIIRVLVSVTLLAVVTLAAACQGQGDRGATAAPPATDAAAPAVQNPPPAAAVQPDAAPAAAAPLPATTVLASAQYSADPDLRCDLLEVKRVSGGALMISWRVVNAAGSPAAGLTASTPKAIHYDFSWNDLYYTDPAENKKYGFLTDSDGNRILEVFWGNVEAGQQRVNWAKFPAPPATSTKISVIIPKFRPFEDVPVS